MKVLYHLPILPPKLPSAEAFSQEIETLRRHFDGRLVYLNPNQHSPIYVPRMLFGFHRLPAIRLQEEGVDLHHIFNPDPFAFPMLNWLRRPVVYSLSGGVGDRRPNVDFFNRLGAVTVLDEASATRLREWGIRNVHLVQSGVDVAKFHHNPLPGDGPIRLLMASAPWTLPQFESKGIDALLAAAQQRPNLHLTLLWRGVLTDEIHRRIAAAGVQDRVTLHDGLVDVNAVLATVHAAVVLAATADIVKAYPHSLLDALAAGKPVLVSRAIPMSAYVEQHGCGQVVEAVSAAALLAAVDRLIDGYTSAAATARTIGQRDFSEEAMIASYRAVYTQLRTDKPA